MVELEWDLEVDWPGSSSVAQEQKLIRLVVLGMC